MLGRYRMHLLLGMAALLVWLNTRPADAVDVVKVAERTSSAMQLPQLRPDTAAQKSVPAALPAELNRPVLAPSSRDPFAPVAPPATVVAKPSLQPAPLIQVAAPQPPSPPPVNLTFAGRMTAPDGSQIIYVSHGDTPLAIGVGQTLPNGYRVEAITAQAVELSYSPLNASARLDLPAPPKYEIR